jgi:phytoene dehydrogenase-like protein
MVKRVGTLVIGGGFGGLAAALALAEGGEDVLLCETLKYPGGCASTFRRGGYQFEAGATLSAGLGEGQLFARWIKKYGLPVVWERLDPVVEMRWPGDCLRVVGDRSAFVEQFVERAPIELREGVRGFFEEQRRAADVLWGVLDDPALLPPWGGMGEILRHVGRVGQYTKLLPLVGKTLGELLERRGLGVFQTLKMYLDAVCQITVQASGDEAEALFALGTLDYFWRGVGHVKGGIGGLAEGLAAGAKRCGAHVWMPCEVRGLEPVQSAQFRGWRAQTRLGEVEAQRVIANVLPQRLRGMLGWGEGQHRALDKRAAQVEEGWGAAMLYRVVGGVVDGEALAESRAHHLALIQDPSAPLVEGNHLFCSVSGADEAARVKIAGERTVTVSTHVPMRKLRAMSDAAQAAYIQEIQDRMRAGIATLAPELAGGHVRVEMTASPQTFARFTGRPWGYVGGIPRRAGLHHYADLWPQQPAEGLYLVGDSVFPGQSTLAAALGGVKVAQSVLAT